MTCMVLYVVFDVLIFSSFSINNMSAIFFSTENPGGFNSKYYISICSELVFPSSMGFLHLDPISPLLHPPQTSQDQLVNS